jgi:hypothetical protein
MEGSFFWKLAESRIDTAKDSPLPKVDVPEGEVGNFRIMRFVVPRSEAISFNARQMGRGVEGRSILPGAYTKLLDCGKGEIWMSDTTAERKDHEAVYEQCKQRGGRVLIHGLGLGMIVNAVLELPNVEHVEVWELEQDVIALVGSHLKAKFGDRLTIVPGDVFEYRPKKGEHWTVVWHDIWPSLASRNLKPMQKMCARWKNYCEWQECWGRDFCRWMAKEERNEDRRGRRW